MKFRLFTLFCFAMSGVLSAQTPTLVVQEVDNQGMVEGNTYRVYMQLAAAGQSVHAIFADDEAPLSISSSAAFFQHELGNFSPANANEWMLENHPSIAYDSWITIGAKDASAGYLWHAGVDFDPFLSGNTLNVENGAWFFLPDAEQTLPDDQGLVLLMQLSTTGTAAGTLNAQGWNEDHSTWQARGLTFSTDNLAAFGCTDESALNFDFTADFDDGSCEFEIGVGVLESLNSEDAKLWNVFPNPSADGTFQLEALQDNELGKIEVSIFDAGGKKVFFQDYSQDDLINGKTINVQTNLASGIYSVNILQGKTFEVIQLLVQ